MAIPNKPTLTDPPPAPVRGEDQTTFANKANALVAWYSTNVTDLTNAIDWQDVVFTEVDTRAGNAETAATTAEDAATAATGAANFQDKWSNASGSASSGGSYSHSGSVWLLLVDVSDITLTEPSDTNGDWLKLSTIPPVDSVAGKTGAVSLDTNDISGLGTQAENDQHIAGSSQNTNNGDITYVV